MIALARGSVIDALSICTSLALRLAPLLFVDRAAQGLFRRRPAQHRDQWREIALRQHVTGGTSFPLRQV
jgi:hypothetical protein